MTQTLEVFKRIVRNHGLSIQGNFAIDREYNVLTGKWQEVRFDLSKATKKELFNWLGY